MTLYLRSRRVPAAAIMALVSTAALWALAQAVEDRPALRAMAVLAAAVGVVAAGPGLAGADAALDRTAAIAWAPRRAAHVLVAAAALAGVLAATTLAGTALAGAGLLVRDVAGLGGLLAIGATVLGAGRAWPLPIVAAAPGVMFGPLSGVWHREVLTWTAQPTATASATVTAVVLGVAGTLAYAIGGGRG
jgi:hypothetical protein